MLIRYMYVCMHVIIQIDLIDMRHLPDGDLRWILHCVDHWSKFNFAYAIANKHAMNVTNALSCHLFPYFGVLRILQSDNGREFVHQVIQDLLQSWHTNIQLVSGRPRHPQSQGLVERAHYTLERKLTAEITKACTKKPPWNKSLPRIVCKWHHSILLVLLEAASVLHRPMTACMVYTFLVGCRCYEHTDP